GPRHDRPPPRPGVEEPPMSTAGPSLDIVIRQARVWGREGRWDVAVAGGRHPPVGAAVAGAGGPRAAAAGRLLAPAFVDPHIHLDKVLVAEDVRPNRSGTLGEAIEILWERKAAYTVDEIVRRASQVIESAVLAGTTRIRSHVDVDTIGKLR